MFKFWFRHLVVFILFNFISCFYHLILFAAHIEIIQFKIDPKRQSKFNTAYVKFKEEGISQSAPKGKVESLRLSDMKDFTLLDSISFEKLQKGINNIKHSAILISAAGQANRLAKQLGKKVPKALIKMNDGLAYDTGGPGITFLEFQLNQVVELAKVFNIDVPVIIWTSETTHKEIVSFLKSNKFFGIKNLIILGFQENVYGLQSGSFQEQRQMDPIGLGHGEVFRALKYAKFRIENSNTEISVADYLTTMGITHVLFTNIEGAIGINPLTFAQINISDDMSVFVVPKLRGDSGGGAYRLYKTANQFSLVIIEDMDKPSEVPAAEDFNTNSIIFRLDILKRYPEILELPISFEQDKEVINQQGERFKVTLGKTCIAQATYFLKKVAIIKGPRLETSNNTYTIYEHMKNLEQIQANAPKVLNVHNSFLINQIFRKVLEFVPRQMNCAKSFVLE